MTQTWTEAEQREHRKQWVEALRSGKYQQATGQLRNPETDGMCCLGVACDISGLGRWNETDYSTLARNYYGDLGAPGSEMLSWLGLSDGCGDFAGGALTELNDNGKTFSEIADIIEAEPEGLIAKVSA